MLDRLDVVGTGGPDFCRIASSSLLRSRHYQEGQEKLDAGEHEAGNQQFRDPARVVRRSRRLELQISEVFVDERELLVALQVDGALDVRPGQAGLEVLEEVIEFRFDPVEEVPENRSADRDAGEEVFHHAPNLLVFQHELGREGPVRGRVHIRDASVHQEPGAQHLLKVFSSIPPNSKLSWLAFWFSEKLNKKLRLLYSTLTIQ